MAIKLPEKTYDRNEKVLQHGLTPMLGRVPFSVNSMSAIPYAHLQLFWSQWTDHSDWQGLGHIAGDIVASSPHREKIGEIIKLTLNHMTRF